MNQMVGVAKKSLLAVVIGLIVMTINSTALLAQGGGGFAGTGNTSPASGNTAIAHLSVKEAERVIEVQGIAEVRVVPTEIRLVMAVVSEGKTANECKRKGAEIVESLLSGWKGIGIESDDIFADFIAIIPVYKYEEQKKDSVTVLQEVLDGYRYQTNLHLNLPSEARAHEALDVAYGFNITNIIVFDYWHPELEKIKLKAMKKAIQVARSKSDVLLAPELFPDRPRLINIREDSKTIFPIEMYSSYKNDLEQTVVLPYRYRNDLARISAVRPRTTFYRGPEISGDALSPELPMKPEISVVSTVRLFFEVPGQAEKK